MFKRFLISCLSLVLVLSTLTACSEEKKSGGMPPPLVSVMTMKKENVPVNRVYVGQTEGSNSVEVRAQVSGILMKRTYEEGQRVKQGDVLFEIEPDTYKAALDRAKGTLAQTQALYTQAQQTLNRVLPLYKQNAVSQQDRDNAQAAFNAAKADVEAARAAVTEAEIELAHAYVKAPVTGYTSKAYYSMGNLISEEGSLLTVMNTIDPIYANFAISSPEYMEEQKLIAEGRMRIPYRKAELIINNMTYETPGEIVFMDSQVNPTTSVIDWRASFPNPNAQILPGQFARVRIIGPELVDALMVPQRAILQTQGGTMVIVVKENNIAEYRPVTFSYSIGEMRLVESGLSEGERIIVEGVNKVRPNSPVRLAPPKTEADAQQEAAPKDEKAEEAKSDAPAEKK